MKYYRDNNCGQQLRVRWVANDTNGIRWDAQSQVVATVIATVDYRSMDGTLQLQESLPFGDTRELF